MRLFAATIIAILVSLGPVASAQADPSEYGIELAEATVSTAQAGAHPDFNVALRLKKDPEGRLPSTTQDIVFELPPGLLGNPGAVPKCTTAQLIGTDPEDPSNNTGCPQASQVGITEVELFDEDGNLFTFLEPIYNMEPSSGEPARFGFIAELVPVMIGTELRSESDYGVTARAEGPSSLVPLLSADSTFWGVPADESHDDQRITPYEAVHNNGAPETPSGKRPAGLVPVPFMLNPTRCGVGQGIDITAIPYALPSLKATAFAPLPPNSGCSLLDFKPELSIAPTTEQAEAGSGLEVELAFPTDGFEHPSLLAGANQRKAEVTLPEGMTVNPSQAVGLGACSTADFAKETAASVPGEGCPESSKIGTVTAKSPLLEEAAEGSLFVAKPKENPFGSLIALYMVLKIPERGVIVKLAGRVEADPSTGQLVTTFGEPPYEIPQLPVESFHLRFREGARSPLVTPLRCGTYQSTATFTSWAGQTTTLHPSFQITRGVEGGPCLVGTPPFRPSFTAGSLNDNAGAHSPFYMRLTRRDGDQDLTKFTSSWPPGLTARLAGVTRCPDAAIAMARLRSGEGELANPSCPASSEVGNILAGAGVGPVLTYATGKAYLAGPYQGAPVSAVAIVPAVAGPFDIGTVVTRVALRINPRTAEVEVDGAASDPIPHILAGIPLKVRDVRVHVDRSRFVLNPTSCERFSIEARIWGGGANPLDAADDTPVSLSDRFQVANCSRLGFKPRLSLRLKGGTERGDHPALTAVLRPRPGDANIAGASAALPRSEFLDQDHIRTVCTRVQFAADNCPKAAIYGRAVAFTPLLDFPVRGPVYLRSSDNLLPDLVADFRGPPSLPVKFELVGRTDSVRGGIRNTFDTAPDVPVSKFVLRLQGGNKGLLINSTDICRKDFRARVRFKAHNGKRRTLRPKLRADCRG